MIGVPAHQIHVIGVLKSYMIRVGNGPFPSELSDERADYIREKGNEYGTVSKRPRRCGWLDLCLVKHAVKLNGVTELAITNVNVLSGIPEINVVTSYTIDGEKTCTNEALLAFDRVIPEYNKFPGWVLDNTSCTTLKKLPIELVNFLMFIEEVSGAPIRYISYGPERKQTLELPDGGLKENFYD